MPVLRAGAAGVLIPALGTQQAFTLPSGAQQGDIIVIWVTAASASNSFSSPGFTATTPVESASGNGTLQTLTKLHTGEVAGTEYTVTAANSDAWGGIIFAVGNEDQSIPFDGGISSGLIAASADATLNSNSLTLAYPQDLLIWLGMVVLPTGTNAITVPAGYTAQVAQVTGTIPGATNVSMILATSNSLGTTGSTGSVVGSIAANAINGALLVAFPNPVPAFRLTPVTRRSLHGTQVARLRQRRSNAGLPQNTGTQFPLFIRQRSWPLVRVPWRINRSRVFWPGNIAQGTTGQAYPSVTQRRRQLNMVIQMSRMVRRTRANAPGNMPQGPLAPSWIPQTSSKRAGPVARTPLRTRRGAAPVPIPVQQAQGTPAVMTTQKQHPRSWAAFVKQPHKRFFSAPITQGRQATGTPAVMKPARTRSRPWSLRRLNLRSRIAMVPIPKRTQPGTAHLTASTTLTATAHVNHVPVVAFSQRTVLHATGTRLRFASAALRAQAVLKAIAHVTHPATAHLSASATLTAAAHKTRLGHASLTASTTLTAAGVRSRGVSLTAPARLAVSAQVTHPVTIALTARTVMTAAGASSLRNEEILIVPLAKPGINEPGLNPPATSITPVTETVIQGPVKDQLYDP